MQEQASMVLFINFIDFFSHARCLFSFILFYFFFAFIVIILLWWSFTSKRCIDLLPHVSMDKLRINFTYRLIVSVNSILMFSRNRAHYTLN